VRARRASAELPLAFGKMSRRRFLKVTGAGLAGAALLGTVGCGGDQADSGEGGTGTFVVARTGDVDTLDPHTATAFTTFDALELVYDSLLALEPKKLTVVPGLAEDFKYSDGGRTLTLNLRKGLSFHDGSELTSEDAKASLERILDEKTGAAARSYFLAIDQIKIPDERTVVLRLSRPDVSLTTALASLNAAIVPKKGIEAGTIKREPNGSGAFVFEEWKQGQHFSVKAFKDYWGEGPYVDRVQIRVIPEESSVLAGLRAGNYHLGLLTDPNVALQAEGSNLEIERILTLDYHGVMLNGNRSPLDEEKVRQAIACAIDRQQLIDSAAFGEGKVTGPITSPAYQYDPTAGLPYDPPNIEAARRLLEEAGYGNGVELNTIVMSGNYATAVDEAQSLKSQLEKIGVTLNLEQLETNVYVDRWLEADFDAAVVRNGGSPDPHLMYDRYFTRDGNFRDVAGYYSDKLDDLMARGVTETDTDVRQRIYAEFQEQLLEASPWVWVFRAYEYRVLQPNVKGFVPRADGSISTLNRIKLQ
jgi:peptide/nickel transport system substrate-binding protein